MSPRLIGAVLALVAATLVVVSIVSSAMWAGHPSVDGREIEKKTVYIGLLGGQGCNTGGDGTCEDLVLSGAFTTVSFVQLGTSSLFVLLALLLALTAFKSAKSRASIGKGAIGVALLCVAVVIAQILIGPRIQTNHEVHIPIGYGMFLFLGGIVTMVLGGILAAKNDPPMSLRSARQPVLPAPPPAPQPQEQIDVLALLQDEPSRPAAPPSPGGMLPGPAGPLGAPLFGSAPQLRPMYEQPAYAQQYAPPTPVPAAPRPPPPSFVANRADTSQDPAMPAPPPAAPPPPAARAKAASVAPPPRVKAPSIPPPVIGNKSGPNKKLPAPGFSMRGPTAIGMAVQAPLGTDPGQQTVPAAPAAFAQANPPSIPAGSPMQAFTGASEPSEEVATRAVSKEPDLMVGTPISHGESDTDRKAPDAESTDVNARPLTDDGEEAATVFRGKKEATPAPTRKPSGPRLPTDDGEEAATVARPKQDPEDLATDPSQARASAKSMPKIPISTASEALPPPKEEKTAHGGPQPACPQCEAPMGWVEEHLRFYCKSCRMYF